MSWQVVGSTSKTTEKGEVLALDQITRALVEEFLEEAGIQPSGESTDFEKFAAHVAVSPQIDSVIDYQNVMTGAGGDTGLDAIAIIINGELITDPDDIDTFASAGTTLDVHYIFVQAESGSSFSTSKIGQISYGVKDFFNESPSLTRNDVVTAIAEISKKLLRNARLFRNGNPTCSVYYITAGRLVGDHDLDVRARAAEKEVDDLNLFSRTSFTLLDARAVQQRYRSLKSGIEREFTFQNRVALPDIDGVSESYLGYLPAQDLLNILKDDEGDLASTIFYENVRDFQGETNPVNSEIANTLSSNKRGQFVLMNNGITVIAKSVRPTGTRFIIQDFQVVNGCQTANMLWTYRERLDSTVFVPLRLISTDNEDVIIDIIKATNRQTEVREEQFYATSDYLKQLEMYFESVPEDRRLFLERRSKQHVNAPIERTRVVPFNSLIRSFASLVLGEPHRATRNYKQILDQIPSEILNPGHKSAVYFAASSSLYRLEFLFRNGILERRFSPAKYHLLLATRLIAEPDVPRQLNGRQAEKWANKLIETYWNSAESEKLFKRAANDIDKLAGADLSRDRIRTLPFTEQVLKYYRGEAS